MSDGLLESTEKELGCDHMCADCKAPDDCTCPCDGHELERLGKKFGALWTENQSLRSQLSRLQRVVDVAKQIRDSRDRNNERVAKMQALAIEARKDPATAKRKLAELDSQPRVWDLGDLVEDLCEALLELGEGK